MIKFDYSKAMAQARELERISDELQTLVNQKLNPGQSDLRSAWKGDSADLFLRKTNNVIGDISRTARSASAVAAAVKKTARTLKAAEDAANRIFGTAGSR